MAVAALRSLAAAAPAPVFVARGAGAGLAPVELAATPGVRLVATPRHATVLLVAGRFPGELAGALARVHDQLPLPRGAVWWASEGEREPPAGLGGGEPATVRVAAGDDPAAAVVEMHRAVCLRSRPSRPGLLADLPPHPFEGRGDHGQGGEGMMGGVPFGRPMAMTGDDRDGLSLDRSELRLGPFLPGLPTGVALDVVLQGGVVQQAALHPLGAGPGPLLDPVLACFERARHEPVPVADLERARARHLLRWVAESCHLAGLPALGARAAAGARTLRRDGAELPTGRVARLSRLLRRTGLPRTWSGVGTLTGGPAIPSGPSARAAGRPVDARQHDPAYRRLGFAVLTRQAGDARARLEQRLAEAGQALELAVAAAREGVVHDPADPLEPPQGRPATGPADGDVLGPTDPAGSGPDGADVLAGVGEALAGMDWADAVVTLCSLDLAVGRVGAVGAAATPGTGR